MSYEQSAYNKVNSKEKKRYGYALFPLLFVFLSFLCLGCDNVLATNEDESATIPKGLGAVKISFVGDAWQARTVFPATDAFDKCEYFFTKQGGSPIEKTPDNGLFFLEPGTWSVIVKVYIGTKQVADGTSVTSFSISSGTTVDLTIALTPTADALTGNGTFKYNIASPAGATVSTFKLEELLAPNRTIDLKSIGLPGGIKNEIPAGYYLLTIIMTKDGKDAGKNEVVHIYDSMTSTYTVSFADIDFIGPKVVPGTTLASKLAWLQTNAESYGEYIIEVNADESIAPTELYYSLRQGITISLIGVGSLRTISLASNGHMFYIGYDVTLILGSNIILQGRANNDRSLVSVSSKGSLIMNAGSKITGNFITSVLSETKFIML